LVEARIVYKQKQKTVIVKPRKHRPLIFHYSKDLKGHVDTMQEELDHLQNLLGGSNYSVDSSTLFSVSIFHNLSSSSLCSHS